MRLVAILVAIPLLLEGALCARADEAAWLEANFAAPPSQDLLVSNQGSLRWVDMLGDRRLRHGHRVESIAVSPDGTWFVSGSNTGILKLWESKTGREIRTLVGRPLPVARVAVSREGTRIFAAYQDGFDVWDAVHGKRLREVSVPGSGATNTVFALSPDGTWAVFGRGRGGAGGTDLSVWETGTGKRIRALHGHDETLDTVAISPNGRRIVSAGRRHPGMMRVWNAETGEYLGSMGDATVVHLTFSPDRAWVVSCAYGDAGAALEIHDVGSGRLIRRILLPSTNPSGPLALSPDGAWVVSGAMDGTLRIVETETGRPLRKLVGSKAELSDLAVSPDGQSIVSAHRDGTIRLWDATTGKQSPITPQPQPALTCLALSPDGAWAVAGTASGSLRLWRLETRAVRTLPGHEGVVSSVAVSPDGQCVYSGAVDGLQAWGTSSGKPLWRIPARKFSREEVISMAPRRDWMAVYLMMKKHRNEIHGIAVAPSGEWLAAGHLDGTVSIRDAATGAHRRTLGKPAEVFFAATAVSPDGTWLAVNSSHDTSSVLRIWDPATGELRRTIRRPTDEIGRVAVHPDGEWVVAATSSKELTIWKVASGERLHSLPGHKDSVIALAVSPDGTWIVSGARDAILVWDSETGRRLDSIRVNGGTVSGLVVRENRVWASMTGGTINVYRRGPPSR